jgi:hypothetical protein
MVNKSLLIVVAVLLFACPAFGQFGQGQLNNRLTDFAGRLSREAGELADSSYGNFSNNSRTMRNDVEAVMLAHQFSGASQIFYRMVVDRRRPQDLRDAFDMLQNLARSVERNNIQRNNWFNIQRLMTDISRELNFNSPGGQNPDSGDRSGTISWRGRVDDDVRISFRGGTAHVETIGGTPFNDGQANFLNSLPSRRVSVSVIKIRGRGDMFVEQQPSRENDFTAIVRIKDSRGGASDYEFQLKW